MSQDVDHGDSGTDDLLTRFGSARHPERPVRHPRPAGLDDDSVAALGKLSEALEVVENARGLLYEFHRLSGTADLTLQEAVAQLRQSARPELAALAEEIDEVLVGRDVVPGRWTFQIVEDYDETYWSVFRAADAKARALAGDAPRHVFEAEMKHREQTRGADSRP